MTHELCEEGYLQTREKLADLHRRLTALEARTDLNPIHRQEAKRSYESMTGQYLREIKLYEATHPTEAEASRG